MLLRLCYGFCWIICFRAAQAFYNLNMNQFATVSRTLLKSTASFTTCRNCHKKYFVDMEEFSNIRYMRCSFCDRKWYQDPEGLLKFSERNELLEGDQYPPIVPLFVMGFPNTFSSDDLVDLFAEYGVVSIRMLPNKRTLKNYAVIAVCVYFRLCHLSAHKLFSRLLEKKQVNVLSMK